MKTKALKKIREKLSNNEAVYGLWVTLESPSITEMAVSLGMDWVLIDAEHGHLDWKDISGHVSAAMRSDTVLIVRIAERSTILSKRALDIGADGIMIEFHENPRESAVDPLQAIDFKEFEDLIENSQRVANAIDKKIV